jgi:hypothetical protein
MTEFEVQKTVLYGFVMGVLFSITGFYMIKPNTQPMTPKSTFKVIDAYKGCDVVQYTNQYLSHYNYFLDCKK